MRQRHAERGSAGRHGDVARIVAPLAALATTAILVWPTLTQSGALAHRDLLFMSEIPLPRSFWWMGPDLGRRLPGFVPLALASQIVDGTVIGRIVLIVTLMVLALGSARLFRQLLPGRQPAYAASLGAAGVAITVLCLPFTTTRLSTGHLTTLWAAAVLPFLLSAAISRPEQTGRWTSAAAAGLLGFVAGAYSLVVCLGVATRTTWRWAVRGWLTRNAVWILPGALLQAQGFTSMTDAAAFRPRLGDALQVIGMVVGRGYWDAGAETVRGHDVGVAAVALGAVGLASIGWRVVAPRARRSFGFCLIVGYGVPLLSTTPGLSGAVSALQRTALGAPLREPHRLIGLGLVPLVVLSALGAVSVGRRLRGVGAAAGPVAVATVGTWLLAVGLPTVHARLEPLAIPASWTRAAALVDGAGGTVLTLPWSEYVLLDIDKPRVVYHPLADLFGSETLASSDPQLGAPAEEAADPRAPTGRRASELLMADEDASDLLARLGVGWVAVLKVERADRLDLSGIRSLERVISSPSLDLYRVVGASAHHRRPAPFLITHADGATPIPWTWGWIGGHAHRTDAGVVASEGTSVFLPALAGVALYVATVTLAARSVRRGRQRAPADHG